MEKIKILNDPVGGFIRISDPLFLKLIDHIYFQRLRNIKQLGLTHLVYPGAMHTRFQHALGAFQLMNELIGFLKEKKTEISYEEQRALLIAILLHDIGHGPFSHALENSIVENVSHETISLSFMNYLNELFDGELSLAISVFTGKYHRPFMHHLISGQLDIDRLDYLRRDSFFTGVSEGNIGSDRIIRIMNIRNDDLVIEQKGIYSIENFLIARRLMYWQVYLHKTVISAEQMLVNVLKRAKEIAKSNKKLYATPALEFFLYNNMVESDFRNPKVLDTFANLDDSDIVLSLKVWAGNADIVLSTLSKFLLERRLFKIEMKFNPFERNYIEKIGEKTKMKIGIEQNELEYFVVADKVSNSVYDTDGEQIRILMSDEKLTSISDPDSGFNTSIMSNPVEKYFLCYPRFNN